MAYTGRTTIYTDVKEINEHNVCAVLEQAMKTHMNNASQINYLQNYEKGKQGILGRIKDVRPEINNKIVENHAAEITSFHVGYVFGSPVTYVQRANVDKNNDTENDNKRIALLNEMMFEEGKASKDQQLAKNFAVCGVGYRMVLPKRNVGGVSPFDIITLNPSTTFVVYSMDVYHDPMMGVSYYVDDDLKAHFGVYTRDWYYEIEGTEAAPSEIIKVAKNGIGMIPIIEYRNNHDMMGCFERALTLLDALNQVTSDRLNGLEQYIQSFIWMNNVDIDDEQAKELKDKLLLLTRSTDGSNPASVQYLSAPLNQTEVQTLADYLYDQILQITGVPGRQNNTGGDTGQAVMLRNGWETAETAARSTEMMFTASERELLKVVLEVIRKSHIQGVDFSNFTISDIDIKFSRNRTDGLIAKTQALQNLLTAGVHPLKSLDIIGLFADPQQVYEDSKKNMAKWEYVEEADADVSVFKRDIEEAKADDN